MANLGSISDAESSTLQLKEKKQRRFGNRRRSSFARGITVIHRMSRRREKTAAVTSLSTKEAGSSRVPNWTTILDVTLTGILKNHFLLGNCIQGQFTRDGWRVIPQQFNQATMLDYDKKALQNRYKILKKNFGQFNELCSRSGWDWDYINHVPTPPPHEPWDVLLQILPHYKILRGKQFPCYRDLEIILEKATATGSHAIGSAQRAWNRPGSPTSQPVGESQANSEQGPPVSTNLTDQLNDLLRTSETDSERRSTARNEPVAQDGVQGSGSRLRRRRGKDSVTNDAEGVRDFKRVCDERTEEFRLYRKVCMGEMVKEEIRQCMEDLKAIFPDMDKMI